MTGELLLELFSEEIPARMQRQAIEDLTALLRDKLAAAELPAALLRGYVTPRRLAVIAEGIPAMQPERREERRGPRLGAPQTALDGFLRAVGLGRLDECEIRDTGRGEFYFSVLNRPGRAAAAVLSELITAAIEALPWPKSMRWPGSGLRWVRPLRRILCLYDGEVLPLSIQGVAQGRTTRGHRFLAPGEISVASAAEYLARLRHAHVVLDQDRRRALIDSELQRRADSEGVRVRPDPALLDEVTGLVEYPVVLAGAIDADLVSLPPEVLATTLRTHQKYFSCLDAEGAPAAKFLFVANNPGDPGTIVAGNERVLRARLVDARFFWDQDRKTRLEDRVEGLKGRVFHARLGSLYDKVCRLEALADFLAGRIRFPGDSFVTPAEPGLARRAVRLAKADLSTGMVGEFPELQGIMGRYYALHDGEAPAVAAAIAEHYQPLGANDACPKAPVSIAAALADRIDSLVGFFAIGETPTGSRDPFALRRAASGVIRLILENRLRLPLAAAFAEARAGFGVGFADPSAALLAFVVDRLKVHLRDRGFRHDLIAAALARAGEAEDDLVRLSARALTLDGFLSSEDGANLLTAYRRASNIVAIEERRDGRPHNGEVDPALLEMREERALFDRLAEIGDVVGTYLASDAFDAAIAQLARLRHPVDAFFDKVTVNTGEPKLRENRLRLLSRIRSIMNGVADFSQIEG